MQTLVYRLQWGTFPAKVRNSLPGSSRWCSNKRRAELQVPCNMRLNKGCMHRAWGRQLTLGRALCNPAAVPPHSRTFLRNGAQRL